MDREAGSGTDLRRIEVLGVGVSAVNLDEAVGRIGEWIELGDREYVCVTGVHGVMESLKDPALRDIHNASGMTTPDGMPLVWCGRYAGVDTMGRVYGPDLMLAVCGMSVSREWTHYFYGAQPGVADLLAIRLSERFPGLKVVGTQSPPFRELSDQEIEQLARDINALEADVIWVGLSTPKQERWMARVRPLLDAPVLIGVGAAFDMHAGTLKQAPLWMQRSGLEWMYRLGAEPRRLWKRYLTIVPGFLLRIVFRRPRLVSLPVK